MPIDYEAEYNNRARVPDHADIFARWEREADAYRAEAGRQGRAEFGSLYGATVRQSIELYFPAAGRQAPLASFVHGGYWRSLAPSMFSHMARGLNAHGVSVAVVGYDLCPQVGIAAIIEEIRHSCLYLWQRLGRRILVTGHSAGGHLAACMLATDWKALAPDAPADLVPAACAISGIFDLAPLVGISMNADLRLTDDEARRVSPLFWPVPAGRVLDVVVGGDESSEFLRQSRIIAQAWRQGMVETRCEEVPGTNHFTVIDALADPHSAMVERLAALAQRADAGVSS
jgi:arylformamidase